jgi:Protein of unknown function (DUF1353)
VPFSEDSEVVVRQADEQFWELMRPLEYQGKVDDFVVPAGMLTDFASVPRPFVWFIPQYGLYTMAAILHDYLWSRLAAKGKLSWIDADAIFRRALRELGVAFLRRWIMWAAVRWTALWKPGGTHGWWREAHRVLLFSVVALPFVLLPAALIAMALAVVYLVELVFWAPLRISTGPRRRRPSKQVNLPSFEWELS